MLKLCDKSAEPESILLMKMDFDYLFLYHPPYSDVIHSCCFKKHKSIMCRTSKSQKFPYLQSDASFGLPCCCQAACTSGPCWQVKRVLMNLLAPLFFYFIIIFIIIFKEDRSQLLELDAAPVSQGRS